MKSDVAGEATVGEVRSAPTGGMEGAVARVEDEWVAREDKEAPGVTVLVQSNCAPWESPLQVLCSGSRFLLCARWSRWAGLGPCWGSPLHTVLRGIPCSSRQLQG